MKVLEKNFKNWKELILSTASKTWEPHSIIVISIWIFGWKLLIADCHMNKTLKNLKENPKISIISWYYRLEGEVEIFESGEYFDICVKDCEWIPDNPKNAILVTINKCEIIPSE